MASQATSLLVLKYADILQSGWVMIMETITGIIFPLLDDGFHVPKPNKNLLELVLSCMTS